MTQHFFVSGICLCLRHALLVLTAPAIWCMCSYVCMIPCDVQANTLDEVIPDFFRLNEAQKQAHRVGLDLYVWPVSITKNENPTIYIRSAARFRLQIYRLGWYGGSGAELKYTKDGFLPRNANSKCGGQSTNRIIATSEQNLGLVEC